MGMHASLGFFAASARTDPWSGSDGGRGQTVKRKGPSRTGLEGPGGGEGRILYLKLGGGVFASVVPLVICLVLLIDTTGTPSVFLFNFHRDLRRPMHVASPTMRRKLEASTDKCLLRVVYWHLGHGIIRSGALVPTTCSSSAINPTALGYEPSGFRSIKGRVRKD